jgi:hypothetical protein
MDRAHPIWMISTPFEICQRRNTIIDDHTNLWVVFRGARQH